MPVKVNQSICIGCGRCEAECPVRAIYINDDGVAECNQDECLDCQACIEVCIIDCIQVIE